MVQTAKLYSQAHSVNNNTIFHAMCLSFWAYAPVGSNQDLNIASRVGMGIPVFTTLTGTNAPRFFISANAEGTQIGIAGTTQLAQWMDYITRAGATNVTGLPGKTFGPFDDWSNRIVTVLRNQVPTTKQLIISGHSLGGAMAVLVAEKLRQFGYTRCVSYTFGCPRVGDAEFTSNYESVVHNVRNQCDVIPSLPPAMLSYVRVLPSFRQILPYMSRPGFDYQMPFGPQPWLNPASLVNPSAPLEWAARIPIRAVAEHLEFQYIRAAWRLGTQGERFNASHWYGVANGIWNVGLSPAP